VVTSRALTTPHVAFLTTRFPPNLWNELYAHLELISGVSRREDAHLSRIIGDLLAYEGLQGESEVHGVEVGASSAALGLRFANYGAFVVRADG